MNELKVAVAPEGAPAWFSEAITAGGGQLTDLEEATALLWFKGDPGQLSEALKAAPSVRWVQLPAAGVERFTDLLDDRYIWTCAKGVYSRAVAEHALALALAGFRRVAMYARSKEWQPAQGRSLFDAHVVILGGGGIAAALIDLLQPFGVRITVVRRHPVTMPGTTAVVAMDGLDEALGKADLVVLALALTTGTRGIIGAAQLGRMQPHAWLVNVARGEHVDTDALTEALLARRVGGAALDVTDPEPLPAGHPLWDVDLCIITPHTANAPELLRPRLEAFTRDNVARRIRGAELQGVVDLSLQY